MHIDTDGGVDDALALIVAGGLGVELGGLSVVQGNVDPSQALENVRRVLSWCGLPEPPLSRGPDTPISGPVVRADQVHGADGLGGVSDPTGDWLHRYDGPPDEAGSPGPAPAALAAALQDETAAPVVCIGPLTNLALALEQDADLPRRQLAPVIFLGGSRRGEGNITPHAEFNVYADAAAAAHCFERLRKITVLPLEVATKLFVTREMLDSIWARRRNRVLDFVHDTHRFYMSAYKARLGREGFYPHDSLAVLLAHEPELFELRRERVTVDVSDAPTRGRMHVDTQGPEIEIAVDMDGDAALARIEQALDRY